jgi:hypothetical protein
VRERVREAPAFAGRDPYSSAAMQLHATVLCMRELLIERGVELTPERADARAQYDGPGQHAMHAWEAYRAVAIEPAFDPIQAWGDIRAVGSGGFLFEALFSQSWPSRHGLPGMPEHYALNFRRQFDVGESGHMLGLELSISVAAADELRARRETSPDPFEW